MTETKNEAAISAAMAEGNKHGVKSTVSAQIVAAYLASTSTQAAAEVKTGWPPGMLQDDSKQLSKWLSNTPNARQDARDAATPPPVAGDAGLCRTDGRCQYAIDSGAEGLGHCPKGKCVMATPSKQEGA